MENTDFIIADQFLAGIAIADIANALNTINENVHITVLDIVEILDKKEVAEYIEKIRDIKARELAVLADGKALDTMRDALGTKNGVEAADKIWKAAGKYDDGNKTVATLAEILKRVMDGEGPLRPQSIPKSNSNSDLLKEAFVRLQASAVSTNILEPPRSVPAAPGLL